MRKRPAWTPPTPEEAERMWIDCVLDMVASGPDEHSGYMSAHWIFQRKVLGRDSWEALKTAARVQSVRLDRATCERIARDWWKCSICGAQVEDGEDDTCAECTVELQEAA